MANSKSNLSSINRKLPRSNTGFGGKPLDLTNEASGTGRMPVLNPGKSDGTKNQSFRGLAVSNGIKFGKPNSTANSATTSSGQELTNLLKQTVSGGITSALGGSFGLGSFGGIGSIVSSIASLFGGGKKTLPPLVEFTLPQAQNVALSVSGSGIASQGGANQTGSLVQSNTATYKTPSTGQSAMPIQAPAPVQNAQIVQAVKAALLNSSSLNDVISEI